MLTWKNEVHATFDMLFNATQYVCMWDPTFKAYLAKMRSDGKHYFVAISRAAKKLIRLIYHLQTTGETYCPML